MTINVTLLMNIIFITQIPLVPVVVEVEKHVIVREFCKLDDDLTQLLLGPIDQKIKDGWEFPEV